MLNDQTIKSFIIATLLIFVVAIAPAQTAQEFFASGNKNYHDENYAQALQDYRQAIKLDPEFSEAYHNLGNIQYLMHDFKAALHNYNKAILHNPSSAEAYHSRGLLFMSLVKYDQAMIDIDKAIGINPGFAIARQLKGELLLLQGEADKACQEWKQAAAAGNLKARESLAKYCGIQSQGSKDFGPEGSSRGANLKTPAGKKDLSYYLNLGHHQMEMREYNEAMLSFNMALKFDSRNGDAYFGRGAAKFAQGDHKGACKDWNKSLSLGNEEAREYIKHGCH